MTRTTALRRLQARLALASLPALLAVAVSAQPLSSIPNPRTRDGTWVTDTTGTLSPETIAKLNATIDDLERSTGAEMAVVVIRSLDGVSIEEAAARLFELWGIGKKGQDNGLLLLWSTGDRRVRVEVGYGLEGVLPDGKVGGILDAYVIPKFKAGDFEGGLFDGVDTLIKSARNQSVALPLAGSESYEDDSPGMLRMLLGLAGIGTGGIGSIVGFRRWRRYRRRRCDACGSRMVRLNEGEDDEYLDKAQLTEERITSVDYDVWKCPACAHHLTLRYAKWLSGYSKCPQCHNRTKSSTEEVLVRATTSSSGSARVTETCAFCSFRNQFTKTLPQLQSSSSSSGGRSGGGGGSSFGGGRSGGGGASRGY